MAGSTGPAGDGRSIARANQRFLTRAVRYMAGQGVGQFIDLGTGIFASPGIHDVARAAQPATRVLYVDSDPVAAIRNRAVLASHEGIRAIHGDIRELYGIFASRELGQLIDFDQPVGLVFAAVLHFVPPEDDPEGIIRTFAKYLVPGSYLALLHMTSDGTDPNVVAAVRDAYKRSGTPAVFRTADQIRGFFAGLDLILPGLVDVTSWPGRAPAAAQSPTLRFLAGVARKTPAPAASGCSATPARARFPGSRP
jgi:hypothetical protein